MLDRFEALVLLHFLGSPKLEHALGCQLRRNLLAIFAHALHAILLVLTDAWMEMNHPILLFELTVDVLKTMHKLLKNK